MNRFREAWHVFTGKQVTFHEPPIEHPFQAIVKPAWTPDDLRWAGPTSRCLCGSRELIVRIIFDQEDREPVLYFTDAACSACGALLKAPTPVDELGVSVYA